MKTFAVVLCALLATAVPAFAHGGGESGGPVMAPGGPPVMSPIGGRPIQSGFPIQGGFRIFSPSEPDRTITTDRKHRRPITVYFPALNYADICRPVYVPTLYQQYQVKGGPPCDVETQNGLLSLPPPFMW